MSTMQGRLWSRLSEGGPSIRLVDFPVSIQISSDSVPSTPSWFGEVTVIAHFLTRKATSSATSSGRPGRPSGIPPSESISPCRAVSRSVPELLANTLTVGCQSSFRCRIGQRRLEGHVALDGREVDDHARPLFHHRWQQPAVQAHSGEQIRVEVLLPVLIA